MRAKQMKGFTCCGDCIYYDWKKHKCKICKSIETDARKKFYDDCPLEDVEPVQKWIPCSERLPDKNGSYIAQVEESDGTAVLSFIVIDHCNEDGTWLHDFKGKKNYRKTIAWMPLPEPYSTDAEKPQTNADRIRSMI